MAHSIFAWRESKRHQPWLCLVAVVTFPPTMVPLELQRRIIDRAIGGYLVIDGQTTVGTVVAFISGFERMADPSRQLIAYHRLASESQVQYCLIVDRLAG